MLCAAACWLAAAPVFAQTRDVTGPWTLTPPMVVCTDLPAATRPVPRLVIHGPYTTDGRTVATDGMVVIKRSADDGLAVGQRYVAQRLQRDPKGFPEPPGGFGGVRVTGWVTIRAIDEHNALAEIEFACDAVESGDFLEPYVEPVLPADATPMAAPDFSDRAIVLFGSDNRALLGVGDVASIDRGTQQGVIAGARYAIYRDRHDAMPLLHIGEVVVLTSNEQTSKVMVTKMIDGIESGDIAVPRRTR